MNVDMQNLYYFQLCQNVSSMAVGAVHKFTFDMVCDPSHINCSIWVIFNDQIVNGSNHTKAGLIPHTIVGYLNSTQSNNKICF